MTNAGTDGNLLASSSTNLFQRANIGSAGAKLLPSQTMKLQKSQSDLISYSSKFNSSASKELSGRQQFAPKGPIMPKVKKASETGSPSQKSVKMALNLIDNRSNHSSWRRSEPSDASDQFRRMFQQSVKLD